MAVVYAKRAERYEPDLISDAVCEMLDSLGVGAELAPDMKVLIKPNLLTGRKPESAVTTHFSVVAAVVGYVRAHGVTHITVADSPAGPYSAAALKLAYSLSGYNIPEIEPYLNYDVTCRAVPSAIGARTFNIISPIAEADYIIDLAKLKTHAMTTMSCAVKNMFGSIPGLEKPDMHCRCPELPEFTEMLCELFMTVKPAVCLVDAVDAMEGNGPSGGDVRHGGYLFASRDGFALDTAAAEFIGLAPSAVPLLDRAEKMGLITSAPEFAGDDFVPADPPFRLPDAKISINFLSILPDFLRKPADKFLNNVLRSFPVVDKAKCVGCGKCAESCPQKIITVKDGKASMGRTDCISCFCCQEMCPARAISARRRIKIF